MPDLAEIRRIGRQQGFPAQSRARLWERLLEVESTDGADDVDSGVRHPDEKQVVLDTNRSFTDLRELETAAWSKQDVPDLKLALEKVIVDALRHDPYLHYYQGLHDVAQLLLVVCGEPRAKLLLRRMCVTYLRDFMLSTLQPTTIMLFLVFDIIKVADRQLHRHLKAIGVEPFFAIASLLTWFAHTVESHEDSCRVFDYLLSSPAHSVLYVMAAAIVEKRDEVLACDSSDMAWLVLSRPPEDVVAMLASAGVLESNVALRHVGGWRKLSEHSCLKTTGDAERQARLYEEELVEAAKRRTVVAPRRGAYLLAAVGVLVVAYAGARVLKSEDALSRWLGDLLGRG